MLYFLSFSPLKSSSVACRYQELNVCWSCLPWILFSLQTEENWKHWAQRTHQKMCQLVSILHRVAQRIQLVNLEHQVICIWMFILYTACSINKHNVLLSKTRAEDKLLHTLRLEIYVLVSLEGFLHVVSVSCKSLHRFGVFLALVKRVQFSLIKG